MNLRVNEIFASIQGEGPSLGQPMTFLRLAGCNLQCRWCDTPFSWNFGQGDGIEERFGHKTYKVDEESHAMSIEEVAEKVLTSQPKNLVITGGEPVLQQDALIELIGVLRGRGVEWVEVETNGTVAIKPELLSLINQINCSPKLSNSGNEVRMRYHKEVLKQYQASGKAIFKFVVVDVTDTNEIKYLAEECGLTDNWLMPQARTREEHLLMQEKVSALAQANGWSYTPREHILLWNDKRGV